MADEKKAVAATTGGAISLSAFASFVSLCCIGPWAVALLGVTGAAAMASWQPARPYILTIAAMMMAWAFWRVYRPRGQSVNGVCTTKRSIPLQTMLWVSAVFLGLSLFADDLQWFLVDPTPEAFRK